MEDLIGRKFGRLTVISFFGKNKNRQGLWMCECDCETPINHPISSGNLRSGHTQSCGCYEKEQVYKAHKKYNEYDLSGEFGIGYTNKGEEFYFDLEDYVLIKDYCWHLKPDGYVVSDHTKMHRIIMGVDDPKILIDHDNRVRIDNRKENLKICTSKENAMNKSLLSSNKSGITGVYYRKDSQNWRSRLIIQDEVVELGSHKYFEDAVIARLQAEKEHYGSFAPQKHLFNQYNIQ